ncbi:BTB/POZ domain-containing protein [Phanerochaete sordida]|uniref:BTB/POZ domain-containing protein n=1 Tax=Phanerochaete sordida TaxID=48140 RepID=A0A9P3G4M1_9APHY|nr:BTB/POZ domain-containing protein [Phanerochaete sordida]
MADMQVTAEDAVTAPVHMLRSDSGCDTTAEDLPEATTQQEAHGEASSRAIIRDGHIWFDDGNLVVRAGSGDGALHAFRCHSSVLAARSPVFRAMFQLPYTSGEPTNGGQCVDLPDDWEDVQALLKFLYGFSDVVPARKRDPATFKIIAGPLRLAAKYEMDSVLQQLVPVLERDWPSRYEDWALIEAEAALRRHARFAQDTSFRDVTQDPAAVLQLAQRLGLRSMLPAAFYELSRANFDVEPALYKPHADIALLSRADLVRLVLGRERLADHAGHIGSRLFTLVIHAHGRI